ncbi:MAG: hypothetical protein RLZZ28_2066 [Bacteroidota bacterium]|jgi:MFS family permease
MNRTLLTIILSQFFCTSLWFAGNAVTPEIIAALNLQPSFLANLTSAVQLGFIGGTLVFALLAIADRFSPSKVFFISAVVAALINSLINLRGNSPGELLAIRFFTGFCLAGIYPVGMKIASDHFQQGLGKSLGWLVGALVLGTALPHLLKTAGTKFPWQYVINATSVLAFVGGLAIYVLVPDGAYRKKLSTAKNKTGSREKNQGSIGSILKSSAAFKSAALGYFGHMWELYAFWAFVPVILVNYRHRFPLVQLNSSWWSFLIIASGAVACVLGGLISQKYPPQKIAAIALAISGTCCILSPFFLLQDSPVVLMVFLLIWGMSVVADSPLFSTLVAQNAPDALRGVSLTIITCIGFSVTILSIQLLGQLVEIMAVEYVFLFLAIGPLLGLLALRKK